MSLNHIYTHYNSYCTHIFILCAADNFRMKLDVSNPAEVCTRMTQGMRSGCGQYCPNYKCVFLCVCACVCVAYECVGVFSRMTFWTFCLTLHCCHNAGTVTQFNMLNITTMSQAWNCLLRAINRELFISAGNITHSSSSLWIGSPNANRRIAKRCILTTDSVTSDHVVMSDCAMRGQGQVVYMCV